MGVTNSVSEIYEVQIINERKAIHYIYTYAYRSLSLPVRRYSLSSGQQRQRTNCKSLMKDKLYTTSGSLSGTNKPKFLVNVIRNRFEKADLAHP